MSFIHLEINKINDKVDSLNKRVLSIEEYSRDMHREVEVFDNRLKAMSGDINEARNAAHESIDEAVNECQQIQVRQNNIIVSGLVEMEEGTLQERAEHDSRRFLEILDELKSQSVEVKNLQRIGKSRNDGKRLLRVKLGSLSDKYEVLKRAKIPKHGKFSGIYINPDQTPRQQRISKLLRNELRKRREAGEEVTIFRGKILPTQVVKNFQ